jgi:hypothetical protein
LMLPFILAMLLSLAPKGEHQELAGAIAFVVETQAPLFKGDDDKRRTAAFVVAVAYRESSFVADAIGDHGRARCAMQLWSAPSEVLTDPILCVRIGVDRLRESFRACGPTNVLGLYASGPNGCRSEKARRISADRLALAARLAKVQP